MLAQKAESTGVEPVRDCSHEFSKLARYRPAHSPWAVGTGFEPARALRLRDLANLLLKPLGHPTNKADYTKNSGLEL